MRLEKLIKVFDQGGARSVVPFDAAAESFVTVCVKDVLDIEIKLLDDIHGPTSGKAIRGGDGTHLVDGLLQVDEEVLTD